MFTENIYGLENIYYTVYFYKVLSDTLYSTYFQWKIVVKRTNNNYSSSIQH